STPAVTVPLSVMTSESEPGSWPSPSSADSDGDESSPSPEELDSAEDFEDAESPEAVSPRSSQAARPTASSSPAVITASCRSFPLMPGWTREAADRFRQLGDTERLYPYNRQPETVRRRSAQ